MVCQSDWLPMIMATDFASGAKSYSCAKEALDYRCGRLNGKALARLTRCISQLRLLLKPAGGAVPAAEGRFQYARFSAVTIVISAMREPQSPVADCSIQWIGWF